MIIKVMFHIPMKLKSELARASMTTSDVNNQWRSNFQQPFEVSLGYESVENVVRSTLSYPNETSKECIQFLLLYLNHTKI
jgi:hypothetical protein